MDLIGFQIRGYVPDTETILDPDFFLDSDVKKLEIRTTLNVNFNAFKISTKFIVVQPANMALVSLRKL